MTLTENMINDSHQTLLYCRDLQKLIGVTLDQVIKPIRKELLKHKNPNSEVLMLEVKDAEEAIFSRYLACKSKIQNKTFEFIAQQISAICNAGENNANLVAEFPKSEPCFQCLNIDDDSIQGFLRIRGIGFMQLLDMPDDEVASLMRDYGETPDDADHVINGLDKIRTNIDLIELGKEFKDDTRELIKYVIELTSQKAADLSLVDIYGISDTASHDTVLAGRVPKGSVSSSGVSDGPQFETSLPTLENHLHSGGSSYSVENASEAVSCASGEFTSGLRTFVPPDYASYPRGNSEISGSWSQKTVAAASVTGPMRGGLDPEAVTKALRGGLENYYEDDDSLLSTAACALSIKDSLSVPSTPALTKHRTAGDTPPSSPASKKNRLPGTPPPKHRLKLAFPLHKSRSHESNLANRVQTEPGATDAAKGDPKSASRKKESVDENNEGFFFAHDGIDLLLDRPANPNAIRRSSFEDRNVPSSKAQPLPSPKLSMEMPDHDTSYLNVPGLTLNSLPHQMHKFEFEARLGNLVRGIHCGFCNNRMSFRVHNCANCKFKVHKACIRQALNSTICPGQYRPSESGDSKNSSPMHLRKISQISLPPRLDVNLNSAVLARARKVSDTAIPSTLVRTNAFHGSPSGVRKISANAIVQNANLRPAHSTPAFQGSDSNSVSSCSSSTPGSPFLNEAAQQSPRNPNHPAIRYQQFFDFPVISESSPDKLPQGSGVKPTANGNSKTASDTLSTISSLESDKTVTEDHIPRLQSMDSQDEGSALVRNNSISVTLREWDIPIECLEFLEVIGHGSFGTVYRGKWHGEVAIKRLDIDADEVQGKARLEAFKREVATLHKTRHESLVLFMGACMKPPQLAIVTQFSNGETLYFQLHIRRQQVTISRAITIASQVAKGMGYLHAKGIVHKDLKTKNIFLESNSKAVIGDFGLFNFMRMCRNAKSGNYLSIPSGWLCYLSPEIIRELNLHSTVPDKDKELPFTPHSDVYAFGTVWYELLTMEWPFKAMPAESIIYQVGKGVKQTLNLISGPKDFKELLLQCWAFKPTDRPEFTSLVKLLDRLPKLQRSPSYPVKSGTISRSHESLVM